MKPSAKQPQPPAVTQAPPKTKADTAPTPQIRVRSRIKAGVYFGVSVSGGMGKLPSGIL